MKKTLSLILILLLLLTQTQTVFAVTNRKGDIDGDSAVTPGDARLALRYSVGLEDLTPRQAAAAAVNGSDVITPEDARRILRISIGLTSYEQEAEAQAERKLASMSLREKLEQMLMPDVRYYDGNGVEEINDAFSGLLARHEFAGVILFAQNTQTAEQTLRLTDALQRANAKEGRTQLLIATDQEGGKITRLATGTQTPGNMALGAIGDEAAAREASGIIGEELAALGINVDFGPVMDVNNEPANPVIGVRSFSDRPELAARLGAAYIAGLQDHNVISALKHFPGHGDTGTDSHTGLPMIQKTYDELKRNELIPFAAGIAEGAEMIMTAHIQYPAIETRTYVSKETGEEIAIPATLSETMITKILRGDMGFDGVVVTDAMNMDAIAKHFDPLDAAVLAINAGVDILLMPFSPHSAEAIAEAETYIANLTRLAENGTISQKKIDEAVRRILLLKYAKGLFAGYEPASPEDVATAKATVGSPAHHEAEWRLAKRAVAMVKNDRGTLPIREENKTVLLLAAYANEVLSLQYGVERLRQEGKLPKGLTVVSDCYTATPMETVLEEARAADYVIAISELYRVSALDPRTDAGRICAGLDGVIAAAHENNGRFILLSANLPYDVARFPSADAILICWSDKGMSEDPRVKDGDVTQYGPNIPAAVYLALSPDEAPTGTLPVSIPRLTADYTYSDEILYPFGSGILPSAPVE